MAWHVMRELPNNMTERVPSHPVDWILHKQANPEMSAFTFRETLLGWALSWGNGYAEIERDTVGRVVWLWPISPDRVNPDRTRNGTLIYDVQNRGQSNTVFLAKDILHVKGLGFDGTMGYSVIAMARKSIGLGMAMETFGSSFFANGTHLGGVLKHPGRLVKEVADRLAESWSRKFSGPQSAFKPAVLEDGMTWERVGVPPEDAQFLEGRQFQVEEICRWFRMQPHKIAHLLRTTFCLPGDTKVFTEDGPKNIAEITPGEKIWSQDSDGQWVLSRVERVAYTGQDEILTIRCLNRTIRCNAQHRIAVRRETLIPYRGDGRYLVLDGKSYSKAWENVWVPAGELQPGDLLLGVSALPEQGGTACPTRQRVSVEFMEVLGLLVGDGFFARTGKQKVGSAFGISHGEQDTYLAHYVSAIEKEFTAFTGPYGRRHDTEKPIKTSRRDKNTTIFYSGRAYDELEACGIVGTAKTKRVPSWIFLLKRELKLAFLRGYLDADGTVNTNGQIRYVSVNRELLDDVRHLCISVGLRAGNLFSSQIKSSFGTSYEYTHTLFSFVCTDAEQNKELGSHTDWYNERIDARLIALQKRMVTVYPYEQRRAECGPGLFATRIQEIEHSASLEPVYDLSVENTHTFIADLTLVHNSNIEQQGIEHVTDTLVPWVVRLEQETNLKIFGQNRQSLFTKLNVDSLLRGDLASRYNAYAIGRQWGWLSINNILLRENMNPIPSQLGDAYLVPLNMTMVSPDGKPLNILPQQPSVIPPRPQGSLPISEEDRIREIYTAMLLASQNGNGHGGPDIHVHAPAAPVTNHFNHHVTAPISVPQQHVTVENQFTAPQAEVNVDARTTVQERPVKVENTVNIPEREINVDARVNAPITMSAPHVTIENQSPAASPTEVNVDARTTVPVTMPERSVTVDNQVNVPEREVNVDARTTVPVTVPERSVTVENQVVVPEREVNVDARTTVQERPLTIENQVNVPEREVNVDARTTIPERSVSVENQVNVPERPVTVENTVNLPQGETHVDNRIVMPTPPQSEDKKAEPDEPSEEGEK